MFLLVSALIYLTISLIVIVAIDLMVCWLYMPVSKTQAGGFKPMMLVRAATNRIRS